MEIIRNEKVRSEFQNKLIRIFPHFTKVLYKSNKPNLNYYLYTKIHSDYSNNKFKENVNLVSKHYQKKFKDTGKPEYDIAQYYLPESNQVVYDMDSLSFDMQRLSLDVDISSEKGTNSFSEEDINSFKKFITGHTPKANEAPKRIVFSSDWHCTAAFMTHDNKIICFDLSESDRYNLCDIKDII